MEEGLCIIQDKVRVVKRSMKRVFRRVSHLGFSHGLVVVLIFTGNFLEEELLFSCFTDIDTLHVHVYSSLNVSNGCFVAALRLQLNFMLNIVNHIY